MKPARVIPIPGVAVLLSLMSPVAWAGTPAGAEVSPRSMPTIAGSVTYRERIALPPDAALEVTVEDMTRPDASATIIGQLRVMPAGQVPIRFEVPYDPGRVESSHQYGVRARILHVDRPLFVSPGAYPVLTRGAGVTADSMSLRRVMADRTGPARPLTNTYWKLTRLGGQEASAALGQREAHFILQDKDRRIVGSGGCNRIMGHYRIEGDTLDFGQVASTHMACREGMTQETLFLKGLAAARGWAITGDNLVLRDAAGADLAGFTAVDPR